MLRVSIVILSIFLTACAAPKKSRYSQKHDAYPKRVPNLSQVQDAYPKIEPKSRGGNPKSYVVLKKRYNVSSTSKGYTKKGIASWYGTKFHGHKTSNGEVYDMYAMTAAHKTLPIPTYVEVKNLHNNKKIIVRVNDRGPFHQGRIIDLSYAAAHKLGILKKGFAKVEVKAIDVRSWLAKNKNKRHLARVEPASKNRYHLQLGAFGYKGNALKLVSKVKKLVDYPVILKEGTSNNKSIFKVQVGPIEDISKTAIINKLLANNLPRPIVVN